MRIVRPYPICVHKVVCLKYGDLGDILWHWPSKYNKLKYISVFGKNFQPKNFYF